MEKNIRKATWNSKILKKKSQDNDSNFLVIVFLQQIIKIHLERRRDDSLMLATIRDDTWNVLIMQYIFFTEERGYQLEGR